MGIIKQGILGGFSGKVGNVVGATWKGISYMRALPASVANPRTEAQLSQRQKFSVAMGFLKPLSQFVDTGFRNFAVRMSGINAAFSYLIRNGLTGTYPNITVNYPNVLVSHGNLAPALNQAASSIAPQTVRFDWEDNSGEAGASATDKTLLVVYNPALNQAVTVSELAERADITQTVTVPDSFIGDQVHCYISYITADGRTVSNSAYAGAVTVA